MVNILKIPPHNYTLREYSVIKILENNKHLMIKTFLNVGFRNWGDFRNHWWIRICDENNIKWKILEIFEENVKNVVSEGCSVDNIILGDILDGDAYDNVDCLLFWHGPEHITKQAFLDALPNIEKRVNKLIIFGMPLGYEPQDIIYNNEHEKHVSEWHADDWKNLGYNVNEVHDRIPAHITAYKIMNI